MSEDGERILIVDDDDGIRSSLARVLRMKGYEVATAGSGESGIDVAGSFRPSIAIVDIRMPGMDGVDAFVAMRDHLPMIRGIFMTAYSSSARTADAIEAGGLSVLAKPLDINQVIELAEQALASAPVLVVDDDRDFLSSLARSLRAAGIAVTTTESLAEAIREIRQRPERVVIADVFLDDGFGHQLLAELPRQVEHPPFILISGRSDWFERCSSPEIARHAHWIAKPVDVEELLRHVRDLSVPAAGAK